MVKMSHDYADIRVASSRMKSDFSAVAFVGAAASASVVDEFTCGTSPLKRDERGCDQKTETQVLCDGH